MASLSRGHWCELHKADRHVLKGLRREQVAFDGVGSMPMARIDLIRVTKQADVEVELAKRSRNKQLREAVSMSERHAPFSSQGDAHILLPHLQDRAQGHHLQCVPGSESEQPANTVPSDTGWTDCWPSCQERCG